MFNFSNVHVQSLEHGFDFYNIHMNLRTYVQNLMWFDFSNISMNLWTCVQSLECRFEFSYQTYISEFETYFFEFWKTYFKQHSQKICYKWCTIGSPVKFPKWYSFETTYLTELLPVVCTINTVSYVNLLLKKEEIALLSSCKHVHMVSDRKWCISSERQ